MDHASRGSAHDSVDRVSALLQQVLEASPETQAAVLDELCARHPECAALLRHGYGSLANLDLLRVARTSAGQAPIASGAPGGDLPRTVGPFRLLELLGTGGMGAVYRAEDTELGRQVALKLIRSEMLASERTRTRFQRESAALARLDHPGLCTVYRSGSTDGQPWIAMRLATGTTLAKQIDARRQVETDRDGSEATRRMAAVQARRRSGGLDRRRWICKAAPMSTTRRRQSATPAWARRRRSRMASGDRAGRQLSRQCVRAFRRPRQPP